MVGRGFDMDVDLARQMVRAAFRASGELESTLRALKAGCSEEEYRDLARGIAAAVDAVGKGVISKAIALHPELEAEIDAEINEYGDYRGSPNAEPRD